MARYLVSGRQVHIITIEIEADSPEDALAMVSDGDGVEIDDELSSEDVEYYDPRIDDDEA